MSILKIGTDCSGIEAPIQALQQLKIPFQHSFSCEIDKYALKSIEANYNPEKIYSDITKRNHSLLPDIDIYVCGFPCQSFSMIGKKMGSSDSRSNIMYQCIKVIKKKLPKIFILENVKNFKYVENGRPFNYLLNKLIKIKNDKNEYVYNVYYDILNTKDYGIPQNRERIFFIGIRKDIQVEEYKTPDKIKMKDLDDFIIDKSNNNKREPNKNAINIINKCKLYNKINKNYVIACSGFGNCMENMSPTITCNTVYYLYKYNRYMSCKECLLLQGFSKKFKQVVSNSQIYKQAGNSMSVNVLKEIFKKIFLIVKID